MILMQLNSEILNKVIFLTESAEIAACLPEIPAKVPFDDTIIDYLNEVSRVLIRDREAKAFSDVITFASWICKGSIMKLKERFNSQNAH